MLPAAIRSFLDEPAVPDAPVRVWRDWALVGAAAVIAPIETLLRTDLPWRLGSLLACLAVLPILLWRRTHPLAATIAGFGVVNVFGVSGAIAKGSFVGLGTTAVLLVLPYALFRWGPGRHAGLGTLVLLGAWVGGITTDPGTIGDAIGGLIVLSIPVEAGLIVRYQRAARARAVVEVRLRERADIARELHDSVAHYLSAIAVQAQAGRVVAATRPERAVQVLEVIEEAASQALEEVRSMLGALRNERAADLAPQQGIGDLHRLTANVPGRLRVDLQVRGDVGSVRPAVHAATYRIVQEALTNAVRHARDATTVDIAVDVEVDAVRIVVRDDGAATAVASGAVRAEGYGLRGMTERATLLDGTLRAGPHPSGGWAVTATLPHRERR